MRHTAIESVIDQWNSREIISFDARSTFNYHAATMQPAITEEPQTIWARPRNWAAMLPAFLLLVSLFVPLVRQLTYTDLDWPLSLNELHGRDLVFGRDVVFTYGPWGFIWGGYLPATYGTVCIVWLMLAIIAWIAIRSIVSSAITADRPVLRGIAALGAVLPFASEEISVAADVRLFMFIPLLLLSHFFVEGNYARQRNCLLAATLGFLATVKFSYFAAGLIAVGAVSADELFFRRKYDFLPAISYFAIIAISWLLAGQRLSDFPLYLRVSAEVTAGYTDAMSLWSTHETRQLTTRIASGTFLVALIAFSSYRFLNSAIRSAIVLAPLGIFVLIVFRSGFVRHDAHELITTGVFLALSPLAFLALSRITFQTRLRRIAWAACMVFAVMNVSFGFRDWAQRSFAAEMVDACLINPIREGKEIARLAVGQPSAMRIVWHDAAAVATDAQIPKLPGSFAVFPYSSAIVPANGLQHVIVPTLRSYAAYTPALSDRNAAIYLGDRAPDHLLFRTESQAEQLPTMDDSRTWLAVLSRYQPSGEFGPYLHLTPRAVRRAIKLTPIGEINTTIDAKNPTPVPGDSHRLIVTQIILTKKGAGRLLDQAFKSPPVMLETSTTAGLVDRYRIIPANAKEGFLLSPLVQDNQTMIAAMGSSDRSFEPGRIVASIRVCSSPSIPATMAYESAVSIRLMALSFE